MRSWWLAGFLLSSTSVLVSACSGASPEPIDGVTIGPAAPAPTPGGETASTPAGPAAEPGVETPASQAPAPPPIGKPGATPNVGAKRVFVTREEFGGNLETVAGADRRCQDAAEKANLGGQWHAWLSSSERKAIDAVTGEGPWVLVDGKTTVFADRKALLRGPQHAIDMDEVGATLAPRERTGLVWTGTERDGTAAGQRSCNDWAAQSPLSQGALGVAFADNQDWTWGKTRGCMLTRASLYCFEQ